jgi:UDP-N-acetylmuramyl pentapeptide phosphotransferase/UDP-N-acetylglucosamine-1-phosphate transferase
MVPLVNLVQNLLGAFVVAPLFGVIAWLAHLLPRGLRQKLGDSAGRPLSRPTGLAIICGFVVALIAFFAWRFHTFAVTIPFIMVAVVAGFFSLVNRIDLRLQARKARKLSKANKQVPPIAGKPGSG